MRLAIITFIKEKTEKTKNILDVLNKSCQKKGYNVSFIDGYNKSGSTKLTGFNYLVFIYKSSSFFSAKLPSEIKTFLESSGTIMGKKTSAIIIKNGIKSSKQCQNLMKVLESQGVIIDYFEVLNNEQHAVYVGEKIG